VPPPLKVIAPKIALSLLAVDDSSAPSPVLAERAPRFQSLAMLDGWIVPPCLVDFALQSAFPSKLSQVCAFASPLATSATARMLARSRLFGFSMTILSLSQSTEQWRSGMQRADPLSYLFKISPNINYG
jgi:hypothetical protein